MAKGNGQTIPAPVLAVGLGRGFGGKSTGLAELVFNLRDLRASNIQFLTVPTTGTGMEGDQSVVYLDRQAGDDLWFAVNNDQVAQWAAARPSEQLSDAPR